jgi:hypothetical protein
MMRTLRLVRMMWIIAISAIEEGAHCISALHALIWHFGGTTSQTTMNNPLRLQSLEYFRQKWGSLPPGHPPDVLDRLKGNE